MRQIVIGAVTALTVWFGSAYAAEAQQITPTGPLAVYTGATNATFTATVTLPSIQTYGVWVGVYKGTSGTPCCQYEMWNYYPTQLVNDFSQLCSWTGGVTLNQKLTFKSKLILGPTYYTATNWVIYVSNNPGTYLLPTKPSDLCFEAIDRDRRHEA